jgi:predicted AlkP superfamily phosphohydrolase/phosphomutase
MIKNRMKKKKVLVIGLDCAAPELMFEKWLDELPNIRALLEGGVHGRLRSCDPPITVPAWSVMTSSRCPGSLGIYGFRNRSSYSYDQFAISTSHTVKVNRLWDLISNVGKRVIVLGVPGTYPVKKVNGIMVSDFMTPDTKSEYTYPPEFRDEIERVVGEYILDVRDFRTDNKEKILEDIYEMTRKRFKLMRHLIPRDDWDFFMMVEMGTDRIHHAFWSYMDPEHRKYEAGHPFEDAIRKYYHFVDAEIGKALELIDDDTTVMLVSDHGAKRMEGGVCINDWLMKEGYLTLSEQPKAVTPFAKAKIDWTKTQAWGDGGYYARIFLNVKGREPQGTIEPEDYEKVRSELIEKISNIPDDRGANMGTRVYRPEELYPNGFKGIAPDLLVYLGNLYWRSIGTVGNPSLYTFDNDTGPDDANHAEEGIFLLSPAKSDAFSDNYGKQLYGIGLLDIAPTILEILGEPIPACMEGQSLCPSIYAEHQVVSSLEADVLA